MAKDKNVNKEIDLKKYNDPSGLSLQEMNFGLWLSEHRQQFLKILTIFLIILCAGLFIFSSYNYVIYFMSNSRQSSVTSVTSPRQVAADLAIAPIQIFSYSTSSDLVALVTNPNDKFTATFQYCFKQGTQDLSCGQGYIMPGEKKYILALGQTVSDPSSLSFTTSNMFWQRLDGHKIPDWNTYATSRLNFLVSNLNFASGAASGLSNKLELNTLSFTIKNQTAYSYYEAPLNILLFNGSDLVGVNRYLLENFQTGQSRDIKLSWPGNLSSVSQTQVVPDINLLDSGVYQSYSDVNTN
jgi:hypothetical protein